MNRIRCYDVLIMVLQAMNEDMDMLYSVDENKLALIERQCDAIDSFAEETDCAGFEIDVNEENGEVTICLDVAYCVTVDKCFPSFFDVIGANTKSLSIDKTDIEGIIRLTLVFESLWA